MTVITGATLIDGTTRPPTQDAVIIIRRTQCGRRAAWRNGDLQPSISLKDFAAMNKAGLQPPRF